MLFVTKADGSKQPFDRNKIVRTALRMRASPEEAEEIATKIESKMYNGIPTKKLLQMLFACMKSYKPHFRHIINLRDAISFLRPKPDFEQFVSQIILDEGYSVATNKIIQGRCIEHEIDVIAKKPAETIYIEVKHHDLPHTFTGMDVFLETNSVFEDLKEGFLDLKNSYNFTKAMVIVNTKISEHARNYADCRGISYLAWRSPENRGLEFLIEQEKNYPITSLKILDANSQQKLGDVGIVTLKQLTGENFNALQRKTKVPKNKLQNLISAAEEILKG